MQDLFLELLGLESWDTLHFFKGHAGSSLRSCDLKDSKHVETVVTIKSTLSSHKRHSCQKKTVLLNGKEQTRHSL